MDRLEGLTHAARRVTASLASDRGRGHSRVLRTALVNYTPVLPLVGPAFPVRSRGSILPVLQALERIPRHHVLVVEDEAPKRAILGDIIMSAAQQQGVAGIVCLGIVRDVRDAALIGMPLWAFGTDPAAAPLGEPAAEVPGSIQVGGAALAAGDWLFGDPDGLVAVERDHARSVIKAAQLKERKERLYKERLAAGERLDLMMNLRAFLEGRGDLRVDF